MKVLLIKTSSMGDIIHTLPAVTDAEKAIPGIEFHWVIEESFKEIPAWLPSVKKIIPVALRRWRKQGWLHSIKEIESFLRELRKEHYDLIIDAQGLVKSALITVMAKGKRAGLNYRSARESFAALFYQARHKVVFEQHAIPRARQLMAQALNYPMPVDMPHAQINLPAGIELPPVILPNSILFFHGTTWPTKHWPEMYWHQLTQLAVQAGFNVLLPWGSTLEQERAQRIAQSGGYVLPRLSLSQMAALLLNVSGCIAVDTGLGHLAAVLGVPAISLYGPTNPEFTGALGRNQYHLTAQYACAPCLQDKCKIASSKEKDFPPCFSSILPSRVLQQLCQVIGEPR
ncbi:MAG: lipopolysaccharide heptosyltransferase I [Gammaproteobacteria bacterium]